ncbi:alpha/beta fold hydrolase [Actinoallomurus rhizosphaericola]|uniref:alpha/beta fold hydrolase n=1 Tax=Actinoallomurus rhizosphaericola TaxID=2952536 RepID=UPI002090B19D|nr:alpha/beta hydrolase [Actinoallomurus rhizosphaericola]MCO5993053.1 alpha/beta hydrolase [Actinoallomurus rhizosphaericola]
MNDRLPGDLMTIGGDRLHVVTEGTGSPPVLLSAGLGGAWFDWTPVVSRLRDAHRVIVFDRPGLGGSPPVRGAATLRAEADRLAALARWAGAPVILVAHSFAGFHAEAFARLHPELAGGMVLVDPSAEPRTPRYSRPLSRLVPLARLAGTVAGTTGFTRLAGPAAYGLAMRLMTARGNVAPPEYVREVCTRGHVLGTLLAEDAVYRQMAADLLTLRRHRPFPGIPLRVITALGDLRGDGEAWRRAHAGLAALSPRGRQVVLPDVGHLVQIDRPEAVARAVREL